MALGRPGYRGDMGMISKVVKLGIAKKIYDEARKPANQQKAREAFAKFQESRRHNKR
ncbi:hypothetical protein GCM10027273_29610 [Nocardioides pakistanensis]